MIKTCRQNLLAAASFVLLGVFATPQVRAQEWLPDDVTSIRLNDTLFLMAHAGTDSVFHVASPEPSPWFWVSWRHGTRDVVMESSGYRGFRLLELGDSMVSALQVVWGDEAASSSQIFGLTPDGPTLLFESVRSTCWSDVFRDVNGDSLVDIVHYTSVYGGRDCWEDERYRGCESLQLDWAEAFVQRDGLFQHLLTGLRHFFFERAEIYRSARLELEGRIEAGLPMGPACGEVLPDALGRMERRAEFRMRRFGPA